MISSKIPQRQKKMLGLLWTLSDKPKPKHLPPINSLQNIILNPISLFIDHYSLQQKNSTNLFLKSGFHSLKYFHLVSIGSVGAS